MSGIVSPAAAALCALVLLVGPPLAGGARAQQTSGGGFVEDVGAGQHVNLSGRLRMLSQRIAAGACFVHADLPRLDASALRSGAVAEYDRILAALTDGDETLGIPKAETDRRVLERIAAVRDIWEPLREDLNDSFDGGTDETVLAIAERSNVLLSAAQRLVSEISGHYSDPTALLQEDALRIDIAGRQRMLSQKISKAFCLVAQNIAPEITRDELAKAISTFDASTLALRFGRPEAGINLIDDREIQVALDVALYDWYVVRPIANAALEGKFPPPDDMAQFLNAMDSLLAQMDAIVTLYTEAAKLGL